MDLTRMKLVFGMLTFSFLCGSTVFSQRAPGGIGASLTIFYREEGQQLKVAGVAPSTPAARAGLAAGQVIRAIDRVPTESMKLTDCVARIRGPVGTKVVLDIEDSFRGWSNSVTLTRESIAAEALMPPSQPGDDRSDIPRGPWRKSLSVTTNQVVRILNTNGGRAFLQFTHFGATNAHYRWRFRAPRAPAVTNGVGVAFADYHTRIDAYGVHHLTLRNSQDDLMAKAGDIWLEWSYGSLTSGWLYYYPSRDKVEVLDSAAFDSDP
jgi:hypothetical protein